MSSGFVLMAFVYRPAAFSQFPFLNSALPSSFRDIALEYLAGRPSALVLLQRKVVEMDGCMPPIQADYTRQWRSKPRLRFMSSS